MQTMTPNLPTARSLTILFALGAAVLVAAAPAQAQLSLPSISQQVATPAGTADVRADQSGAAACLDAATPALPSVPVPALPLPIGAPALPDPYANSKVCADASLDGVSADADADAMGLKAGTGADVDTSEQHETAKGFVGTVKSIVGSIAGGLKSLSPF